MSRSGRTPTDGKLTPKGEATRQRIVAAAAQLMYEGGVAEATLEMVRAAAGVSGSQIYHYFADKQALVRAVIEYQTETVLGQEPSWPAGLHGRDPRLARRPGGAPAPLGCRGGCPIGALGGEVAEIDPGPGPRWPGDSALGGGHPGRCPAMHARGELGRDASPDRLATTMLAALQGGLLLSQVQRSTEPLEVALDTVIDYLSSLTVPAAP